MHERTVGDKCYRHLDCMQILNKLHKVGPGSGLSSSIIHQTQYLDTLSKTIFPLLCGKIGSLGKSYLLLLLGIAERTHRTVKIAVVRHTKNCNNRTPPSKRHICPHLLISFILRIVSTTYDSCGICYFKQFP